MKGRIEKMMERVIKSQEIDKELCNLVDSLEGWEKF